MYSINHDTVQVCNWCNILCLQFVKYPINLNQSQINHNTINNDPLHPVPPSPTPNVPVQFPQHIPSYCPALVTSLLPQYDLLPLQPPHNPQPDRSPPFCDKLPVSPPVRSLPPLSDLIHPSPSPPLPYLMSLYHLAIITYEVLHSTLDILCPGKLDRSCLANSQKGQ